MFCQVMLLVNRRTAAHSSHTQHGRKAKDLLVVGTVLDTTNTSTVRPLHCFGLLALKQFCCQPKTDVVTNTQTDMTTT